MTCILDKGALLQKLTFLWGGYILWLVSLIMIEIDEGHNEKLPLLLKLSNYESCLETSFLSIPIFTIKKQNFSITISTQLAKAEINSPLAATEVHQEGQLHLALHIPSASLVFPVL